MSAAAEPSRDATEKAVTEDLLDKLLSHSEDLFFIGRGNVCEYESASVKRVCGYSWVGPLKMGNIHPDDQLQQGAKCRASVEESLATGKPASQLSQVRVRTRDGWLWTENRFCFNGLRWYGVFRDASKAKKTETMLRDFLTTTSHDARTPLSSIQVASQLLLARPLREEAIDLLTAISASARVLLTLVNNVMLMKRLETGDCEVTSAPVAIRELVADAVNTSRVGLAHGAGTSIVWDETPLPEFIVSSQEHLTHMLLNMFVFSLQAARCHTVHVHASCGASQEQLSALILELDVAARGCTLSAEELASVFEPFSCAEDAGSHAAGSAPGRLGLHVSRRLAEVLGGELRVRSDEQEGVVLTALIPVAPCDCAAGGAPPAAPAFPSTPLAVRRNAADASDPRPRAAELPNQDPAGGRVPPPATAPEEDTGFAPYLPPEARAASAVRETDAPFQSLKLHGELSSTLDLLLSNTPDAFFAGEGWAHTYASPGTVKMMGFDSKEELLGVNIVQFLYAEDLDRYTKEWDAARAASAALGHAVSHTFTGRINRKDGSHFWAESACCITPTHWYGVRRDISDRKRLEASLKEFLTSMMAELRQPLTSVQAASELLAQRACVKEDEEACFLVSAISASCTMLSCIVSNVLSLRSMEQGECVVAAAPFCVRDLVASVLAVCRMSLAHRSSVRVLWLDESNALPPLVLGDADRIAQVLQNLLTNAVKFCDGSDVTVSVQCEPAADGADADRRVLTLMVADGGRGMTPDECARIFDAYYRAPTHRGGGTGLGLHICKRFVEAMCGRISLESAPGRGARFTVVIPVRLVAAAAVASSYESPQKKLRTSSPGADAAAVEARVATPSPVPAAAAAGARFAGSPEPSPAPAAVAVCGDAAAAAQPAPEAAAAGRRLRVLLVDDHQLNLRLCKRLLETQGGLVVTTADDGDVALQHLIGSYAPGGTPVDFVLMDLQMPRLDGLQATKRFRAWELAHLEQPHHLPIFALSANVFEEKQCECADAGMDGFMHKPLRLDALRQALAAIFAV